MQGALRDLEILSVTELVEMKLNHLHLYVTTNKFTIATLTMNLSKDVDALQLKLSYYMWDF